MLNPPSLPSQISGGAFSIQTYGMFGTNKLFLHISLENLNFTVFINTHLIRWKNM